MDSVMEDKKCSAVSTPIGLIYTRKVFNIIGESLQINSDSSKDETFQNGVGETA